MMPSKLIALFFWMTLLLPAHLAATTYYLDFTNGSDTDPAHDGKSPAAAWKSISKIGTPQAGDEILFKRGEKWLLTDQWYISFSGTQALPITFGAYGDVNDELPQITDVGLIPDADITTNWMESMTSNIWTFPLGITPGRLFLDGEEVLRASTLADVGTTDNEGALGYWFFENGTLYLYAEDNPASLYSNIEGSSIYRPVLLQNTAYLHFANLDFRGGSGAALTIFAGSNLEFSNCAFGHSGNSGIEILNFKMDGTDESSTNITIENNVFDSGFTFFYGLGSERGCRDGVRLKGGVSNCTVAGNTFINWAHDAVVLEGLFADAAGVNDNLIYDNHISAPDIPYAHPLGADGLLGKCQNNEFYRNYIENCRTASQINGNDNWVHHNIIVGMRRSPSKNSVTAHAFILSVYGEEFVCQNNRFDHNLIIDTDESAFLIRGYGYPQQVQDNAIRNNIIYETGLAPLDNAYQAGTGLVIYDVSDGVAGNSYQNNLFYSSTSTTPIYLQDSDTYLSTAAFNALNGTEGNTIGNNKTGDPLFTDLENGDYLPQDNSPAVNAGMDVGLTVDYALQDRFVGPAPDIGPLETDVLTPLPVEWADFSLEVIRQKVILYWKTLTEIRSDHFVVERSSDGIAFEPVGQVGAAGFSSVPQAYQFLDVNPPVGTVYYRLQQVDVDGAREYSDLLSATIRETSGFSLLRPTRESVQLMAPAHWNWENTALLLFDQSGRKCMQVRGTDRISLHELPAAAYLLILKNGHRIETFRFVK